MRLFVSGAVWGGQGELALQLSLASPNSQLCDDTH